MNNKKQHTPNQYPPLSPRLLYDETEPDGYLESDLDFITHNGKWLEWCEENANLLATAPDLLDALKAVDLILYHYLDDTHPLMTKVRTAIAKAEM